DQKPVATRKASEMALEAINPAVPSTIGGSADLTGSNNTKTKAIEPLTADNYAGRYVYYGIREFGMAAAMNGMALHGGVIPYGGTFLVFTDYARPAIRLSALQNAKVIYVMTHDSIGLGAAEQLEGRGIGADVVSRPCTERFDAQPQGYRDAVLPDDPALLRVSIEAGTTIGWERYTGLNGIRIGIDRFGVSAPAKDAYEYFGLTPDAVAARVLERVKQREMA